MPGAFAADDELSDASPIELRRGTRLGRYELLVPIARGGMARVWAARQHGQRGFTKLVAIKTILPHLAREAEFERMFLDEARIASLVHHPNVCEIYELGDDQGILYLAMEWVSGDSLMHVLRASKRVEAIDLRVAARIVADGASGLHAAHELTDDDQKPMSVVHRDVSPHNILISGDGHVKVADFGVAKALGQMHSATIAGQIKGKIAYMAPEQITSTKIDRRSDIFSLGCILYESVTGLQPFLGDSDPQVMHAIMKGDYVMPSTLMVGFPRDLEEIIKKALAADVKDRYANADQMKLALEQWLAVSGPLVTTTQVAALVKERIGPVLEKRREKIREATQAPTADVALTPATAGLVTSQPSAGSTSGIRPHQEPPRRSPSRSDLGNYASSSGSYPGSFGDSGSGSGPGKSVAPGTGHSASGSGHSASSSGNRASVGAPPMDPNATSHGRQEAAIPNFNPVLAPQSPVAPKSPLAILIAFGIGIAVFLALAIVVVLIMSMLKKPAPVGLAAPASTETSQIA